jgi:hypothetical protein
MKTKTDKIIAILSDSNYSTYDIVNINEYNAKQFEVKLYDDIKENTFYLDINLYEGTICEINPKTRVRTAFQKIKK